MYIVSLSLQKYESVKAAARSNSKNHAAQKPKASKYTIQGLTHVCLLELKVSLADLESAKAAARSRAAKKNAARKAKKAAEGEASSVTSVTNGMANAQ